MLDRPWFFARGLLMSFDLSKVVADLGDDMIAKCGEPVGLNKEQSVRVAHALAARFNLGGCLLYTSPSPRD